jgi:hypothetical protein
VLSAGYDKLPGLAAPDEVLVVAKGNDRIART